MGQFSAGEQNLLLGWAAFLPHPGVHSCPSQSVSFSGASFVIPSHQTPPSSVRATLVKTVSFMMDFIATGFVSSDVPGATPKKPFSGLIARRSPYWSNRSQAISSPTHVASYPFIDGFNIARLVFPQAEGKAAVM